MNESFERFGGWLKAYFVFRVIGAIVLGIGVFFGALSLPKAFSASVSSNGLAGLLVIRFIEAILALAITVYVLSIIKQREAKVPTYLVLCTIAIAVIDFIGRVVGNTWIHAHSALPEKLSQSDPILISVGSFISALAWLRYFQVSKRVKIFYGANAFERRSGS